jgi:hypothetical protein
LVTVVVAVSPSASVGAGGEEGVGDEQALSATMLIQNRQPIPKVKRVLIDPPLTKKRCTSKKANGIHRRNHVDNVNFGARRMMNFKKIIRQ